MEKRALAAIALSFLIFFGFDKLIRTMYPTPVAAVAEQQAPATDVASNYKPPMPATSFTSDVAATKNPEENFSHVESEKLKLTVSETAGSLTSVRMKQFVDPETHDALHFIETETGETGVGAVEVWIDGSRAADWSYSFKSERSGYLFSKENEKIKITQKFKTHSSSYGNDYSVVFENKTAGDLKIQYRINAGSGIVARNQIDKQYIEANWIRGEKIKHVKEFKAGKIKQSEEAYPIVSVKSRHFSSIFKASGTDAYYPFVEGMGQQNLLSAMRAETNLHANQKTERNFLLYLGPNRVSDLQPYELDVVVNFGKMDAVCKLLIGGMQAIAHIVKNYGVAIILLTLATNIVLSPLTKASFMSMQRMQLVQPQIAKLREKYKGDPTKLNHETMAIYKKQKINPMGGCFPMIVQMPIFISLYVALSKSIDLLNAKFLWVKDLASPDVVPLPFSLPLFGDTIHVLPLIMVVAMVMQQKISMASMPQADPTMAQQQKMMMTIMPVFFGFIFYPMPSGLVIYWLTNTIVTTTYQKYLRSQAAPRVPQAV